MKSSKTPALDQPRYTTAVLVTLTCVMIIVVVAARVLVPEI